MSVVAPAVGCPGWGGLVRDEHQAAGVTCYTGENGPQQPRGPEHTAGVAVHTA